jgi:hypothetical protein
MQHGIKQFKVVRSFAGARLEQLQQCRKGRSTSRREIKKMFPVSQDFVQNFNVMRQPRLFMQFAHQRRNSLCDHMPRRPDRHPYAIPIHRVFSRSPPCFIDRFTRVHTGVIAIGHLYGCRKNPTVAARCYRSRAQRTGRQEARLSRSD